MTRYWVEFKDYQDKNVGIYVHAYHAKQVRDMLPDYGLFIVEQQQEGDEDE